MSELLFLNKVVAMGRRHWRSPYIMSTLSRYCKQTIGATVCLRYYQAIENSITINKSLEYRDFDWQHLSVYQRFVYHNVVSSSLVYVCITILRIGEGFSKLGVSFGHYVKSSKAEGSLRQPTHFHQLRPDHHLTAITDI